MKEILHTWYDSTTYSRDDKKRVPSCWTYNTGKLQISILNNHRYVPGKWVLHCFNIGMDTVVLKAPIETPLDEVQSAAICIVKRRLSEMLASFTTPENTPE